MTLPLSEIERLAEIKSKATPGEWRQFETHVYREYKTYRYYSTDGGRTWQTRTGWTNGFGADTEADATFIAESHNAFDALLSTAREAHDLARENAELRKRVAALKERLPRPLWHINEQYAHGVYVPKEVAVCPECGGELQAASRHWETGTGRPVADGIELDCETYLSHDSHHSFTQDKWQPVIDAVVKWCGARVDYPPQRESPAERDAAEQACLDSMRRNR